jgi:hypothetical protein
MGLGPRTGRKLGSCVGSRTFRRVAGMGVGFGAGLGLGLACRRGFGRRARTVEIENEDLKTEKELLEEKRAMLQEDLDAINKQLESYDEN